ncbi:TonB-dependent receptor [Erythrobacter sp. NAP1]|uniref:TonB-dependent receptor domain-containing protein n=1 Tax=Erythrobacter sp. NAP1 TaxID=237727 RepID=UPI0000686981|nr:TonB-dependent receptor [Erythrobacter sp. NAP1]EAQ29220.1 TonB-dependent receptor [Erythrobacter sp. NAP1]
MKKFHNNSLKALAFSASAIAFAVAGPVYAQDTNEDEQEEPDGVTTGQGQDVEVSTGSQGQTNDNRITVTGSRIVRDTYSSISPLQVLSTENQQSVGAFDPAQILQRSEAAAGTQIDATFQGFVLDNGPGSQTINLRGIGAGRTLVLVNGRRLAPAGVEGAPTVPSINLIPATLVDRYDLLTDGASSVYGSDAVAGVVNVILRKDFDGLEIQANGDINPQGAGEDYSVSAAWGFSTDRAVFGIGAEYQFRDEVQAIDRDFLRGCTNNLEEDANGNIFTLGVADNAVVQDRTPGVSVSESECIVSGISGRIFQPFARFGSVYFPANGNIANFPLDPRTGRPFNFGESTDAFGTDLDVNGDGIRDVDFQNVNVNASEAELFRTFISQQELVNVFTYGEYTFPGEANITPFFEAQYTRAEITNTGAGNPQIFPSVPDLNGFNPCNFISNPDGVDCRAVDNELLGINGTGAALSTGFTLPTVPIAAIRGDRNNFDVTQEQYRGVLGVRGDLPFIGSSWTFELAGVYSRSEGVSSRLGIREDRMALALGLDPTADYDGDGVVDNDGDGIADDYDQGVDVFGIFGDPLFIGECNAGGLANPDLAAPDLNAAGCVPVNLFAPSVLTGAIGDFATQAERDYLFDSRDFDTTYEQVLVSGYVTGDLFDLPAGPVGVVLGAEWREDSIESNPDLVASNGLLFGFFADGGASGSKWIRELFGEVDIPLMAGETLVEELTLNVSGRLTDEEFYGTNGTYAIKGGWRPVPSLLFKMSYGTSFRAPNLRENFLRGQSGFVGIFDPCAVPDDAFVNGAYDASLDQRQDFVLQNCLREGRDPTSVGIDAEGLNTIQVVSGEVTQGGSLDINPETSRSITTGFAFEENWASGFDFALNVNYYDIKIKDAIIEPSAAFIVGDCYFREEVNERSEFCDRIEIDPTDRALISGVQAGFLNRDEETVRGLDINATMGYPLTIGDEVFDLTLNLVANHLIERRNLQTTETGDILEQDFKGEFGFPDWTGRLTGAIDWNDWRFTYQVRYIDSVNEDFREITVGGTTFERPFGDAFSQNAPGTDPSIPGAFSPTCLGAGGPNGNVAGDGNFCRPIGTADEYFEHTASIRWDNNDFRVILGVRNLFDTAPPQVSSRSGVLEISNTPLGNGYDLNGREFFAQVLARF